MAAKNIKPLSIAEIEKNIEKLTRELHQARIQKVTDAKGALKEAQIAVMAATTKVNQFTVAGTKTGGAKSSIKKAEAELVARQALVIAAEENVAQAKLELDIAVACANEPNTHTAKTKRPTAIENPEKGAEKGIKNDAKKGAKKTPSQPATTTSTASATTQNKVKARAVQLDLAPDTPPLSTSETRKAIAEAAAAPQVAMFNSAMKLAITNVAATEETRAERTDSTEKTAPPKPLPVDQDRVAATVGDPSLTHNTFASGHNTTSIMAPSDNPLPKPQPV